MAALGLMHLTKPHVVLIRVALKSCMDVRKLPATVRRIRSA